MVKSQRNKFTDPLKRFSLYLFIIGGRLLYESLYANLKNILPSITTINRLFDESNNIQEGILRFAELKAFLQKRNYPTKVFISEDQTAIVKRIQYDPKSNKMVGFVVPSCKESGFPLMGLYKVTSFKEIERAFREENVANNAYVYMAQPLVTNAPAFRGKSRKGIEYKF